MTERARDAADREAQADALETELLRRKAEADPTPANKVAHAVSRWLQGCVHGAPGACGECNDLFLAVLRSHLSEASPPRIDCDSERPEQEAEQYASRR